MQGVLLQIYPLQLNSLSPEQSGPSQEKVRGAALDADWMLKRHLVVVFEQCSFNLVPGIKEVLLNMLQMHLKYI